MNEFKRLGLSYCYYILLKDYNLHEKMAFLGAEDLPDGGFHVTMAVIGELTPEELELYEVVDTEILSHSPDDPVVGFTFVDYSNRADEFPTFSFHRDVTAPPGQALQGLEKWQQSPS